VESSLQTAGASAGLSLPVHIDRRAARLSRQVQAQLYVAALVVNDVVLSLLAFLTAAWARYTLPLPGFNLGAKPSIPSLTLILFAFVPLWVLVFASQGLYQRRNLLGGTQEYSGVFKATGIGILTIVILGFMRPVSAPARGWLLLSWFFAIIYVTSGRFLLRRVVYALRRRGYFLSPALIIGTNNEAQSLAEQLQLWQTSGLEVLGFVCNHNEPGTPVYKNLAALGSLNDLEELIRRLDVEELILATSALSQETILSIFRQFGVRPGINLRLSSGLFEIITTGMQVKEVASVPLVQVNQVRLTGTDWAIKTVLDLTLAFFLALLVWPLFLGLALAVRVDSPGPVFYRRRVMGLNGSQFYGYKFRTMVTNGDEILAAHPELKAELERTHKLKEDPRVTRVGRFLRKYSLDELPQLINVFKREMSVVGPRMIAPEELAMYDHWDLNLLTVPPGITGLWQVSGRSEVPYAERVQLDMRYIRNWSLWLDIHILLRTVMVVIRGHGAY
jgi:exopolysaccharide biosynthesis polyprenyl glycosylphosphotransferase